jgi:hypothetical protein
VITHDTEPSVTLGARHWEHTSWRESFYPGDMPDEWRLTYYNTQFNCVFLDHACWAGIADDELARWRDDTHDHFVFLLEGDSNTPPPAALGDKAVLLPREDARLMWFDRATDLKHLRDWLTRVDAPGGRRYLLSRDADLGQMERVSTLLELLGC